MKPVLWLLSKLYGFLASFRRFLYDSGILNQKHLPRPVISVGNLSVGGTGKTPTTISTAKELINLGYKVCVLSRGYKRKSDKLIVASTPEDTTYEEIGDEPYLLLKRGIPVAVYQNRYLAGIEALKVLDPDIFILDDGFQHFQLHRDVDILVTDATRPFWEDELLPLGRLREPKSFYIYADCIVVTRVELAKDKKAIFSKLEELKKTYFIAQEDISSLVDISGNVYSLDYLKGKSVIIISGLGNNTQFFETVKKLADKYDFSIENFISLPDHYDYLDFKFEKDKIYLTSEKDIIKIKKGNVYALRYDLKFDDNYIKFILNRILPKIKEEKGNGKA